MHKPSYVSFEYALSYHGLIPERVYTITSATSKKSIEYSTSIGNFSYQKIPAKAYSLGIDWKYSELDGGYFIATPEKALCDKIYADKRVKNLKEPEVLEYLEEDLRIDYQDLLKLDRFADISARKLVDAIQEKKTPPLEKFILGLGIRHVGSQTAIDLANRFESIPRLAGATLEQLEAVEGIGKVVAESILAWFADEDNAALLDKFESLGVKPRYEKHEGALNGVSFVVTGTLESMSRDDAAERIRAQGGIFQTSVGKDTKYLVAGGKVGTSKLAKAQAYGTVVLDEDAFLKLLKEK